MALKLLNKEVRSSEGKNMSCKRRVWVVKGEYEYESE
jgi:hypothetical protein